jgi:hypothetical protein
MSIEQNIIQMTFGVSFNHMFKLLDSWGEIADDILYNNKYFSPEFFSNISTQYTTERRLFNPEKNHTFLLTSNNLIFTQTIESNFQQEYEQFKKRIAEYLVPNLLTRYVLVVRRLGIVYTCQLGEADIQQFASKYFNPSVQNIIDFRFSRKELTDKGRVISGNNDFINKIFTVGNIAEGIQGISYDYQLHFSPLREDVRDTISSFLSNSMMGFTSDVISNFGGK